MPKGIEFDELLTEIESIVAAGTKIDINYYINEVIDEDKQDEILIISRLPKQIHILQSA
jgi:ATP-dependent DNA helicase RecQ